MARIKTKNKLSTRIIAIWLMNALIIIGILSFGAYKQSYRMVALSLGSRAAEIAELSANTISAKDFESYVAKQDTSKESYKAIVDKLQNIRKLSGSKYLYALRKNESEKYVYVLDASEEVSEFNSIAETYHGFDEANNGALYTSEEIDIDEFGYTISAYAPIKDGNKIVGIIGVDYDAYYGYKELSEFKYQLIVFSAILAIISVAVAFVLSRYISKPIEAVANVSNSVSNLDFTVQKLKVKDKGEIGVLTTTFNIMLESIGALIGRIKNSSETVKNTSQSLFDISEDTIESISQLSATVEEISQASDDQVKIIQLGTNKANELADSIKQVSIFINDIIEDISKTETLNKTGQESIKLLTDKSKVNIKANQEAYTMVKDMENSSSEIGSIIDSINSISDQTNLLALNASIEAARAGEYGKGFAVVADEIGKLAAQSLEATNDIRNLIENMQQKSKEVSVSMETVNNISKEYQQIEEGTNNVLSELSIEISSLASQIFKVEQLNNKMMEGKDEFITIITQILSLCQDNYASTEEGASLASNVSSSVAKFNEYISELEVVCKNLFSEVERFKIKE